MSHNNGGNGCCGGGSCGSAKNSGSEDSCGVRQITLSDLAEKRVKEFATMYPSSNSAIMPALYIAQEECGWLTKEAIAWVSDRLSIPAAHVYSVASFYTMYYKSPVGKYHVQICRTLSCMLRGARGITAHLQKRLGCTSGQLSADGMWSWEEVECLGSCGTAPMVQINDVFFENLTPEKLDAVMDRIEKEQPDLRLSMVRGELGAGMSDHPRSQVWS